MASTDYDYIATRNELLERSFRLIGVLSPEQGLSSNMYDQGIKALNSMVKAWQNKHVFLWTLKNQTVTLVATDADYNLSADPPVLWVEEAYFVDSASEDEKLEVISWRDYQLIRDKDEAGDPQKVSYNPAGNSNAGEVLVWPVPDAAGSLKIVVVTALEDWEAAGGSEDFPVRWQDAIVFGLAHRLSPEYGLPLNERSVLKDEANELFYEAKMGGQERSEKTIVVGAYD